MTEHLFREARRGNREAVGRLLTRHMAALRAKAMREVQEHDRLGVDLADVLQRTLRLAEDEIGSFAGCTDDQWLTWLFSLLQRSIEELGNGDTAADHTTVHTDQPHEGTPASGGSLVSEEDREALAALIRMDERLRAAIADLPAVPAQIVRLRQFYGWTLARIAGQLGLDEVVVAGLLRQGLRRLRQTVETQHKSDS